MDLEKFNQQAFCIFKHFQEFPGFECFWNDKFIKLNLWAGIEWEVRVIFSFAFNAPVFYFRPRTVCLGFEEVLERVLKFREFVSQAEFPETGEPFYFLHPCQSGDLLLFLNLPGWLSIVLQVIGIHLPITFYESLKIPSK
jgi:hypothetical protein